MANVPYLNPARLQDWQTDLSKLIGSESVSELSETTESYAEIVGRWNKFVKDAQEASIFTGKAAQDNFEEFQKVNNSFKEFFESLSSEFNRVMEAAAKFYNSEESAIALGGGNVEFAYTALTNIVIPAIPTPEVTQDEITYDSQEMTTLSNGIGTLKDAMSAITTKITALCDQLDTGSKEIWDGPYAQGLSSAVTETVEKNNTSIGEAIDDVAGYILKVATATKEADEAAGAAMANGGQA